jgi:membrane-associated phospholipid phosphatase
MDSGLQPLDRWLLENRRNALILAAALAACVAICWIVIQTHGSFPGDGRFISWMRYPHPSEPFGFLAHVFALLGNPIVACLSVALVWALVDRRLGHRYGVLVLIAVGAVAVNALLKTILGPTPLQRGLYFGGPVPANFPSGHVVYITSLCALVAWFALARGNRPILAAMLLLMLAMGPFRIVDGAHWPSDVLAGYALGLAWAIVVLVIGLPWAASRKAPASPDAARAT